MRRGVQTTATIAALAAVLVAAGCKSDDDASDAETGGDDGPTTAADSGSPMTTTDEGGSEDTQGASSSGGEEEEEEEDIPEVDCGAVEFPEGTGLRRYPYLQSVGPTSARVAWTSTTGGPGMVRVAPSADGPWSEFAADWRLFETAYTYDVEDYTAYDATLTDLEPNSAYCYEVIEDGEVLARGLSLGTAWASEDDRTVRIVAFGDSGDASDSQKGLRDQMLTRDYDVFLHLGDMAYGSGTFTEFEERVFDIYRDLLHEVPTYPTPGNHEYKTEVGQPYLDVYYLWEQALRDADQERYYSFDYGDVHFVSLDSNGETLLPAAVDVNDENPDDMLNWLEADLAATDKPWKIAFFHHPPYSSSERDPNVLIRNGLLPTLEAGGVDLVLCGHDHHYERTKAIKEGDPVLHEEGGIYYFVVGSGGAGLRAATGDWWTESVDDQNHAFLDLRVRGCVAVGQAINIEGDIIDEFELDGC